MIFDDNWKRVLIVLGTFDEYDNRVCALASELVLKLDKDKYDPLVRELIKVVAELLKMNLAKIGRLMFLELEGINRTMMRIVGRYDSSQVVERWAVVEQRRKGVLAAMSDRLAMSCVAGEIEELVDCVNQAGASTFAAIYLRNYRKKYAPGLDFLAQANALLSGNSKKDCEYVSAVVLIGVALEKSLRVMCEKAIPKIPTVMGNGRNKMMTKMAEDLKSSGVITLVQFRQLESWIAIRNAVAHGEVESVTCSDVKSMLEGVRAFLKTSS